MMPMRICDEVLVILAMLNKQGSYDGEVGSAEKWGEGDDATTLLRVFAERAETITSNTTAYPREFKIEPPRTCFCDVESPLAQLLRDASRPLTETSRRSAAERPAYGTPPLRSIETCRLARLCLSLLSTYRRLLANMVLRYCAKCVHRSFRKVEHAADWAVGKAGPLFVVLCTVLVSIGIWTFFTSMFTNLSPTPVAFQRVFDDGSPIRDKLHQAWPATVKSFQQEPKVAPAFFLNLAACLYIVWSIAYHYYRASTEPPGGVLTGLSPKLREQRQGPGSSSWWMAMRTRAAKASVLVLRRRTLVVEPATPMTVLSSNDRTLASMVKKASRSGPSGRSSSSGTSSRKPSPSISNILGPTIAGGPSLAPAPVLVSAPAASSSSSSSSHADRSEFTSQMVNRQSHRHTASASSMSSIRPASVTDHGLVAPTPRPGAIRNLSTASSPSSPDMQRSSWESSTSATNNATGERVYDPLDMDSDDLFPLAKMCMKCPKIPLYRALAALPPELRLVERALRGKRSINMSNTTSTASAGSTTGAESREEDDELEDENGRFIMDRLGPAGVDEDEETVKAWLGEDAHKLVPPPKPERTHHCSICKTCVLKYVSIRRIAS